jgi:hypothetical protein
LVRFDVEGDLLSQPGGAGATIAKRFTKVQFAASQPVEGMVRVSIPSAGPRTAFDENSFE